MMYKLRQLWVSKQLPEWELYKFWVNFVFNGWNTCSPYYLLLMKTDLNKVILSMPLSFLCHICVINILLDAKDLNRLHHTKRKNLLVRKRRKNVPSSPWKLKFLRKGVNFSHFASSEKFKMSHFFFLHTCKNKNT